MNGASPVSGHVSGQVSGEVWTGVSGEVSTFLPEPAKRRGRGRTFRILMTVDAGSGVWPYALALASALVSRGNEIVFAGFGRSPSRDQIRDAGEFGDLLWFDLPLDWSAQDEADLTGVSGGLEDLAAARSADILHLNVPSQAARLTGTIPAVVMAHSCLPTWFLRVRGEPLPADVAWLKRLHRAGFDKAAAVVAPSAAHAADIVACYGPVDNLAIVANASSVEPGDNPRSGFVFASARWWDEARNGLTLDRAAAGSVWPVVMAGESEGPNSQSFDIIHSHRKGPLSHRDTVSFMRRCGIFASPSLYEPFGQTTLEAARTGAALVLADIPAYREIWDGAAVFAAARDPADFAAAINMLAGDEDLRRHVGSLARERGQAFSTRRQADAVLSLYAAALAQVGTDRSAG